MNETKGTLKHAAVYSAAALLGRAVSFLMLPFYAHMLQAHGYGIISLLDVGLTLLATMGGYSSHLAIMRNYHEEKDPARKAKVISTGFYLVTGGALVLVLPFMILARPLASLFLDGPASAHYIILSMLTFVAQMSGQAATTWLIINRRSVLYASINLFQLFIGLSLNIWLIVIRGMGLDGYFLSALVTATLVATVFIIIFLRDCGKGYDKEIAVRIRDFLLPLVPGNLVRFASRQFEKVFIRFWIDVNSVGLLEMAYRFPVLISMLIVSPFMSSWDTRRFEIADQPDAPVVIGRMYTWYLYLLMLGGLILAVNIELVLRILTPPEFHLAYRIARVEVVTLVLDGTSEHLMFGLLYAKHTSLISRMRAVIAVGKILLAWFFITTWGIYGAAFSAAVAALVNVIASFILGRRRYRLVLEWGKITTIVGVSVAMFLVLTRWDIAHVPACLYVQQHILGGLHDLMMGSFLAHWKEGKVPALLVEQTAPIAELMIKVPLSASFALLLPFIHRETRLKMARFFSPAWLRPRR